MHTTDRQTAAVTATALTALLAVALTVLYGLQQALTAREFLFLGAVAYTLPVLAAAARWAVPVDLVLARTLKWAALTAAFVTAVGTVSAARLLRTVIA